MKCIRTKDLIKLLNEQDPNGGKILYFRITDAEDEIVAFGDCFEINVYQKYAQQTSEGDKEVLILKVELDTNV